MGLLDTLFTADASGFPVRGELPNERNKTPRTRLHAKATFYGKIACLFVFLGKIKKVKILIALDWLTLTINNVCDLLFEEVIKTKPSIIINFNLANWFNFINFFHIQLC